MFRWECSLQRYNRPASQIKGNYSRKKNKSKKSTLFFQNLAVIHHKSLMIDGFLMNGFQYTIDEIAAQS